MKNILGLLLALSAVGCTDNSNQVFDMSPDFAISTEIAHVGVQAPTCCMVTRGAQTAMYLANPMPGKVDSRGNQHAALGELHIVNALGVDYKLGDQVPAFGYQFSPDGTYAMFAKSSTNNYSLNFATVSYPNFPPPLVQEVIHDGIQDLALNQQSFFSPSGRFLIIGVLRGTIANSPDLHIVDVRSATDVATLGNGAFDYQEVVAPDDTMVYSDSTASTKPGTPSVQGIYQANLSVFANGNLNASPLDTHVLNFSLMGTGETLLYTRYSGELMLLDLAQHFLVKVADNVMSFSAGPGVKGPIVWIGTDRSLHVANQFAPELVTLPADTVDPNTPIVFSADASRMYYFKNINQSNSNGDLYSVSVAPGGSRVPNFVGSRISTQDFNFFQDRFVYIRNVDATGVGGELVSAQLDGTQPAILAEGVQLGGLRQASPNTPSPPGGRDKFAPVDLAPAIPQPIQAVLTNTQRLIDPASPYGDPYAPINGSSAIVGELSFGVSIVGRMGVIDPAVHAGQMRFSDDGYILAYAGGAKWDDNLKAFTGTLKLQPTIIDTNPIHPNIDGVSEIGPIFQRAMFVSAPGNAKPGVYFVKF